MVQAASELMRGVEPYSSHTKILLKEPRTGGAWEWHQDFGYWYAQGINQPDKIVSAIVAVDENSRENGAMRILTRSHRLGRLDHGVYGGQAGADPERVLSAMVCRMWIDDVVSCRAISCRVSCCHTGPFAPIDDIHTGPFAPIDHVHLIIPINNNHWQCRSPARGLHI